MDDEIRRVEAQIEAASKTIDGLFAVKNLKRAGKATFDSDQEKELQYWINEKEALRKEKLIWMSKNESPAPAPPGNSITIPQVLPHYSIAFPFCLFPLSVPLLFCENYSPLQ